ncbi:hypothetical protein KKA39_00345 [Patescibacteria group bacterium]|nr:hypothetical protein [Patescibacteria group bacterium]MBU1727756.1 hypothetical protein [Patescibacteria group bacterium]
MYKARLLLIFGVWVAILPYLGFPNSWKNILFTLSGLIFIYLSYVTYREFRSGRTKKDLENFSENSDILERKEPERFYYQDNEKI